MVFYNDEVIKIWNDAKSRDLTKELDELKNLCIDLDKYQKRKKKFETINYYNKNIKIDCDFKQAVKDCREAAENGNDWEEMNLIGLYSEKYDFLEKAIRKLGYKKIETLKYVQKAVKAELLKLEDKSTPAKIMSQLKYNTGEFTKLSDAKKKLQSIYNSLDLNKKAKAGDLKEYYDVKQTQKRIDGKQVDGYVVIRSKARVIK